MALCFASVQDPTGTDAATTERELRVRGFWKDGLRFQTEDGKTEIRFGGKVFLEGGSLTNSDAFKPRFGQLEDTVSFRSARFRTQAFLGEQLQVRMEQDFSRGTNFFINYYFQVSDIPYIGNFRLGRFREPVTLDSSTGASFRTFMERALPTDLNPGRNSGAMIFGDWEQRATYAVGVFRSTTPIGFDTGDGELSLSGRLTALPWLTEDGRSYLHLGISASQRNPNANRVRLRSRPETRLAPRLIDTGSFPARAQSIQGAESALVLDSLGVQGEWVGTSVSSETRGHPRFGGYYVQVNYFLTGEQLNYVRTQGRYGRVRPQRELWETGSGAWELATRYSTLNLNGGSVRGGVLKDWTFGVNAYLNSQIRIMANYIRADLRSVGITQIVQLRIAVDF